MNVDGFLSSVTDWAQGEGSVEAVLLVGSFARGENRPDSDIDIVVITSAKEALIENKDFFKLFGEVLRSRVEYYGACTSLRVWYENGIEAEFGLVEPSWIDLPLDSGTKQVLGDGYAVLLDKSGRFERIKELI